ncbi:hypothetical protein AKO1_014985 [Acrasis kona]|uniref:Uncharacterized protein n=1 Tax=Acrasis kona TaxID=1008807 RepID=A0AAW2Z1D3_9EUKA
MSYTLLSKSSNNSLLNRSEFIGGIFNTIMSPALRDTEIDEEDYKQTLQGCTRLYNSLNNRYQYTRILCIFVATISFMSIILGAGSAAGVVWMPDLQSKVLGVTFLSLMSIVGTFSLLISGLVYFFTRNHYMRKAIIKKISLFLDKENEEKYQRLCVVVEFKYTALLSSWYNGAKVQYLPVVETSMFSGASSQ